jgi:predicted amidohydrolase YtcJ
MHETPRIHTARMVRTPTVEGDALLIADGTVVAVGLAEELQQMRPDATIVDHGDNVIVPGMRDAHFHPVSYAAAVTGIGLKTARDLDEVYDRLRAGAADLDPGAPLIGHRIDDESLADGRLPTAVELDEVTGDRPALVMRYCGHVGVANSAALEIAGITATSPDPGGGIIDRAPDGTPTGVLREGAVDLVTRKLGRTGPVSQDSLYKALLALAGEGITSIGAMVRMSYGPLGGMGDEVGLLLSLADRLPLRVHVYAIAGSRDELQQAVDRLGEPSARLTWAGYKGFADGSFGGHTAAMNEPYADKDTTGTLLLDDRDRALSRATIGLGGDVALHAIGDRAVAAVLDFFEELIEEGAEPHRLRMEHASVFTPDDIDRMGRMGVGAAVQPAFLNSEVDWIGDRVGPDRLPLTYAFRSMRDAGVRMAGSSDCPVEPPDPWAAMSHSRTRCGIVLEEALSPSEAFELYTAGGAALLGEPAPLAPGSPADFIVVDDDPVTVSDEGVAATRVLRTFVDGSEIALDPSIEPWPE